LTRRTRALVLEWLHARLGDTDESIAQCRTRPADETPQQKRDTDLAEIDLQRERMILETLRALVDEVTP
jgi:hypothetical protein